jgi:hypothetical protein
LLSATELAGPVNTAKGPQLDRHDLRYWQPRSLGEALFNYWD